MSEHETCRKRVGWLIVILTLCGAFWAGSHAALEATQHRRQIFAIVILALGMIGLGLTIAAPRWKGPPNDRVTPYDDARGKLQELAILVAVLGVTLLCLATWPGQHNPKTDAYGWEENANEGQLVGADIRHSGHRPGHAGARPCPCGGPVDSA